MREPWPLQERMAGNIRKCGSRSQILHILSYRHCVE